MSERSKAPSDVWGFTDEAPVFASDVADLWHWSTNFAAGEGPFTLFLDMIGWSDENIGDPLYMPTAQYVHESRRDIIPWDSRLGYVELSKLADALKQYADRPQDVRAWVDELLTYDES